MPLKSSQIEFVFASPFAELDYSSIGLISKKDFSEYVSDVFPSKDEERVFIEQFNPVVQGIAFRTKNIFSTDTHLLVNTGKIKTMEELIECLNQYVSTQKKGFLSDSVIPIVDDRPPPSGQLEKVAESIRRARERGAKRG